MMEHSLCKEASQVLCNTVQSRINNGDAQNDKCMDSKGTDIHPNRFWANSLDETQELHDEGPCMEIQVNI